MLWTKEMFGVEKPIIALLHLRALPGDPLFGGDMDAVVRQAHEDLIALQDGGVDGILIANEFSLPYQPKADAVTISPRIFRRPAPTHRHCPDSGPAAQAHHLR